MNKAEMRRYKREWMRGKREIMPPSGAKWAAIVAKYLPLLPAVPKVSND